MRRWLLVPAMALLVGCQPAATPTPAAPTATPTTVEATEGELLTKALLFGEDPLEICMDNVQAFAERVVGEPVWSNEQRQRASAYLTWFESHC